MRRYFVVRTNERLTNRQLKRDLKLSAEFFGRAFRALISVSHENSKCMGNMRETCNIVARSKRKPLPCCGNQKPRMQVLHGFLTTLATVAAF